MKFLQLIRFKNLLLIALMQLIIRFGYLEQIQIPLSLFYWQYTLLILSTVLIASGGCVITAIFDQESNQINNDTKALIGTYISESAAYNLYAGLTIAGVGCGFILANSVEHSNFAILFVLVATLLYFYASSIKNIAFIGNILIASILSFSIIIIGIFDIFPNTFEINQQQMSVAFSILMDYAKFVFIIYLVREIIKNIINFKEHKIQEIKTLPVVIGIKKSNNIAFLLLLVPLLYLFYYSYNYLFENNLFIGMAYILVFVIAPMLVGLIQIWNAKDKEDYTNCSKLLKWIIFFGVGSIWVITYNIKHHG
jgi:4-hydroxybenzoate polyprenyltransferase